MALFVASLAFSDERLLTLAKLGILNASLCAAVVGSVLLALTPARATAEELSPVLRADSL
jgi:Na+/H+ antiporter NhaA